METAKVDVRKLQLLNDRINQTIDALNQVRLSVHGLQHTTGLGAQIPFAYGAQGYGAQPFGAGVQQPGVPFGAPGMMGQQAPWLGGISHTSAPWGAYGYGTGIEQQDPFIASRYAQTFPYAYSLVPPVVPGL